jgi:hypothetical protein
MYAKTNLGAEQLSRKHLSPQRKRVLAGAGIALALGLGGVGAWAALSSDTYAGSAAGCVNVIVPSSTGGATLHHCGAAARSFCQSAFASGLADQVATRARPQCRLAGLAPAGAPASP